LKLENIFVIF